MNSSLLLPVVVGFATVLQAGLNRGISKSWGLSAAILLNSIVVTLISVGVWLWTRSSPERFPEMFRIQSGSFSEFDWWYWVSGVFGFTIVAGIPFAIHRVGALQTFVILIGSQIVGSMGWDALVEGRPINAARVAGAVLAFLAAALVNWKG
jgi:transporter family-2 protein